METRWERAMVIGASSGIGEAIARRLAAEGTRVALVGRNEERLEAICRKINASGRGHACSFVADVRVTDSAAAIFQSITTELGGLDLVVYTAGIMPRVAPMQFPTAEDVATVETNFAGAVAWLNAAADRFARARSGTIVGISSVAGDRGRRPNPVYGATKAALATYLESLRNRLAGRGVKVVTVKPGFVLTPLVSGLQLPKVPPPISAERAAAEILDAAARGRRMAYIPEFWRPVAWIVKLIPGPIFQRLNF